MSKHCFSQKKGEADDVYSNKIIADTVSITEDVFFDFNNFIKGYIILPNGTRVDGPLRFNGNTVIFKDTVTDKTKRYSAGELKGFTVAVADTLVTPYLKLIGGFEIGLHPDKKANKLRFLARGPEGLFKTDTFKVYSDTILVPPNGHAADFGKKQIINFHFIKVMVYGNRLSLYKNINRGYQTVGMAGMPGGMMGGYSTVENVFYFKRNNEKTYTELPKRGRPFRKLMAIYLKDDPKLVDDINKELLDYSKIDQIVDRYNQDTNAR
jgi:hypothetical protein